MHSRDPTKSPSRGAKANEQHSHTSLRSMHPPYLLPIMRRARPVLEGKACYTRGCSYAYALLGNSDTCGGKAARYNLSYSANTPVSPR